VPHHPVNGLLDLVVHRDIRRKYFNLLVRVGSLRTNNLPCLGKLILTAGEQPEVSPFGCH
jgi:hypothetical protein